VGLILDLAVAALALLVIASLGMLAWTLGVSAVRATRQGRRQVADAREIVAEAGTRARTGAAGLSATLATLVARTTPTTPSTPTNRSKPGDEPDA
jgi:hypothetical protein